MTLPPFARGVGSAALPRGERGVKPRDAASLILLRHTSQGAEVLLGRRARQHRFLPNVYVFPGGRIDSTDLLETPINDLIEKEYSLLSGIGSPARMARALGVAASRETWEETGLALGDLRDGRLCPDLSGLRYLGRAITPAQSPIRFHARFFAADAERAGGGLRETGELLDLAFRPLDEALRLPLADVTEFILTLLNELGPDLRHPRGTAFWSYRRGKPVVRWEG